MSCVLFQMHNFLAENFNRTECGEFAQHELFAQLQFCSAHAQQRHIVFVLCLQACHQSLRPRNYSRVTSVRLWSSENTPALFFH